MLFMCAFMECEHKEETKLVCNQPFYLRLLLENLYEAADLKAAFKAQITEGCSSLRGFQINDMQSYQQTL